MPAELANDAACLEPEARAAADEEPPLPLPPPPPEPTEEPNRSAYAPPPCLDPPAVVPVGPAGPPPPAGFLVDPVREKRRPFRLVAIVSRRTRSQKDQDYIYVIFDQACY